MNQTEAPKTMEQELNPEGFRYRNWQAFVEGDLVDFFADKKLEKLSLEDGKGNKAKLSRTKDNGIKVEFSSTTIL